jgi:nitrate/nitrite-specific signal transduction histidine kinase
LSHWTAQTLPGLRAQLKASAVSLIVLVMLAGALMHWIVATMLKRLITIRDAMNAISSGTDDLSQRLPEQGNDEVAQIAHAFNAFSDKLAVVMVKLRDSSHSVQQAAQDCDRQPGSVRAYRTGRLQPARDRQCRRADYRLRRPVNRFRRSGQRTGAQRL